MIPRFVLLKEGSRVESQSFNPIDFQDYLTGPFLSFPSDGLSVLEEHL